MNSTLPSPTEFKDYTATRVPIQSSQVKTDSIPLEQVSKEFNNFEPLNDSHTKHLLDLFPKWMYDNAHQTDMEYFTSLVRYDRQHDSLVIAVVDNKLLEVSIVSFKHRLKHGIKWKTMTGTHPNNTVMYRVWNDESPTLVVEGIRDFIAGVLLGWNIIGVPTASYKGSIGVTSNDTVHFLIEDDKAEPLMMRLAKESATAEKGVFIIPPTDEKMDLTDICYKCSNREEVQHELTKTTKD